MFMTSPAASSTSTLHDKTIHNLKDFDSLTKHRFSLPNFEKLKQRSTSSFSDDSSDTSSNSITPVESRFVLQLDQFSSTFTKKALNRLSLPSKVYKSNKYLRRQSKEVQNLPHQLQILFERGLTPLNKSYTLMNKKLGDGAMGKVYLVQRKSDKKWFAAKMHSKDSSKLSQAQYLQRIADEIVIASKLHHENIISTVDFVSTSGKYMTIMEYCPTDLFDLISSKTLTSQQIDFYFVQLLLGVSHMHQHGIAHRDLKLENLCVNEKNQLKIIDFGCSTIFQPDFGDHEMSKGVFGSDPYIAPEIWNSYSYDAAKVDLWSLAIIYVAMHSGRFLFDKAQPEDPRFDKFFSKPLAIFEKFKIPEYSHNILIKLLNPNPNSRATLLDVWCEPWIQNILSQL